MQPSNPQTKQVKKKAREREGGILTTFTAWFASDSKMKNVTSCEMDWLPALSGNTILRKCVID